MSERWLKVVFYIRSSALNILTKICVVLLLVASLVASVVFISIATVGPNWRAKYDEKVTELQTVKNQLQEASQRLASVENTGKQLRDEKSKLEESSRSKIQAMQAEVDSLKAANSSLAVSYKGVETKLNQISATSDRFATELESLRKKLEESERAKQDLVGKLAEVQNQLVDEQSRQARLQDSLKEEKNTSADYKRTIEDLNAKLAVMEKVTGKKASDISTIVSPATRVDGKVTDVSSNLVSINVGSANGLRSGMTLIVYRGDKLVGMLKLQEVSANQSVGVIEEKQSTPMNGDMVTSSLE